MIVQYRGWIEAAIDDEGFLRTLGVCLGERVEDGLGDIVWENSVVTQEVLDLLYPLWGRVVWGLIEERESMRP